MTLQDLAILINNGFQGMQDHMDKRFAAVNRRFDQVEGRFDRLEKSNEQDHDDIKIRLDQKANQFEVTDHEQRLQKLENLR